MINLSVYTAFGQTDIEKKSKGIYRVGYREYKLKDTSRKYKPGVSKENALFFRPVEMDVWYPAKVSSNNSPLAFRFFVSLNERRANSFQDSIKYNGLTDELMQHFTIADKNSSGYSKTMSYPNAEEIKGRFPLIIYMAAYNGMSYENVPLFETLASNGYIVISISSIGRYPGNMTTKYPDVLEQVKDADFAVRHMDNKNIDTSKIGLIGYSYGGLAGILLSMHNQSVKAMLSLDGSEMHAYGEDKEGDKDFNEIRKNKYFVPSALQLPYAYLGSDNKDNDGAADSIYRLPIPNGIKNRYTRLLNAEHEDFSCLANFGAVGNKQIYQLVNKLTLDYFSQYLGDKKTAFDNTVGAVLSEHTGATTFNKALLKITGASGRILLKGKIVAAESNNRPVSYASLGIPAGDNGTVADSAGIFSLSVDGALANDIVRISSLGYQSKSFTVKELSSLLSSQSVITLNKQENQLQEVVIQAKKVRVKTVGNTSKSKFFSVGFPLKDLGSEVGVKVSLGKRNMLLRSFNFNISYLRLDSATFRFNIYAIKNGIPSENLLKQNILIAIGNNAGNYKIDLTPYRLLLKGEVLISLEWIAGKTLSQHGNVQFSAGLLASSYHRKTTEAKWVQFKGLGAGFNLQVQEVK
ncbi:carboxypeptidase-like regulatory domain-containing protein [Mucilaginibacter sp. McL0603]|uniref:carboxypeptidase-like regulatory domain-containing protein n=1 Tax=Mucilaginibacter sp. McL0603 TaxID=3415670 RepID=UPI003CEC5618